MTQRVCVWLYRRWSSRAKGAAEDQRRTGADMRDPWHRSGWASDARAEKQAACHRLQPPHRSFFRICLSVRSPRGRPRKKQDKRCAIERYVCSVVAEQSVMRRPPEARIDTPGWLCAPAAAKVSLSFDPARGVFRAIRERWSAEYQHLSADAGHGRRLDVASFICGGPSIRA